MDLVYTLVYMETMSQEPQKTNLEKERMSAMQISLNRADSIVEGSDGKIGYTEASQMFLEEIKGGEGKDAYRLEEAAAKLSEYLKIKTEAEAAIKLRGEELEKILPGILVKLTTKNSDEKYLIA